MGFGLHGLAGAHRQEMTSWLCPRREKLHYIRNEGAQGVEKLSCDADLVILLR